MQTGMYRIIAIALVAMAPGLTPAVAQHGGGGGGGACMGSRAGSPPVMGSQRAGDMDRVRQQNQTRLKDGTGAKDQTRAQTRTQIRDQDRVKLNSAIDGQMSGWRMLGDGERLQFHQRMQSAQTAEERNRIRAEHQETIRQRQQDLGVGALKAGSGKGAGISAGEAERMSQMLTERERLEYHERIRAATSEEERARLRTEMQTEARKRAQDMGIDVPDWYGQPSGD